MKDKIAVDKLKIVNFTLIIVIYSISVFFSLIVQMLFYLWFKLTKNRLIREHKIVFNYVSGIIGDGILIPLTNVFAVATLNQIGMIINPFLVLLAFVLGLMITFLFHFVQRHYQLTNWTMPEVGNWNGLGIYHAVFMFFESSFLVFTLLNFANYQMLVKQILLIKLPIKYAFLAMFLFAVTFMIDYREIIIKKLRTIIS